MNYRSLTLALLVAPSVPAFAQDPDLVPGADVAAQAAADAETPDGWTNKLSVGANAALQDSRKVVGVSDGTTFQLGVLMAGSAFLHDGNLDWENSLTIAHTQTKTPSLEKFVKTIDDAQLSSALYYSLNKPDWLGPFARARAQTAILPGAIVFADDTQLQIDGAVDETGAPITEALAAQTKRRISGAFEPLTLRQSLGFFARPTETESITLTITAGGGAQEIVGGESLAAADDDATAQVELVTVQDSIQAGVEVEIGATGALNETITYAAMANVLHPLVTTADTELTGTQLTNVTLDGKLSIKLAKWASLDYVLSAKRQPLVANVWQIQNGLLLTSTFNLL